MFRNRELIRNFVYHVLIKLTKSFIWIPEIRIKLNNYDVRIWISMSDDYMNCKYGILIFCREIDVIVR